MASILLIVFSVLGYNSCKASVWEFGHDLERVDKDVQSQFTCLLDLGFENVEENVDWRFGHEWT